MDLTSNIRKYNIFQFFRFFILFTPIIVLFWQQNGLDLRQIFILQAIYAITILVMEVPSGFFADIYSRKLAIALGSAAIAISAVVYAASFSFLGFMTAEIIWGLGGSLISGADTALIYDTLVDIKRKEDYKKIEGHAEFLRRISEGTAAILGGLVAAISLRTTIYATIIPFVVLFFVALSIKEPKRHVKIYEKGHLHHIYKIIKFALHKNKTVKWLVIYSSLISAFLIISFWFYQPYFELIGIPVVYFGLIFAGVNLVAAVSSKYAHVYEKKIGFKLALVSLPVICAAAFFLMGRIVLLFSFAFIFLFQFARGINIPLVSDAINRIVWREKRATVLSLNNMVKRIVFVIFSPFLGWFADIYTIPAALLLSGVIVLVGGGITLVMMHVHKVF